MFSHLSSSYGFVFLPYTWPLKANTCEFSGSLCRKGSVFSEPPLFEELRKLRVAQLRQELKHFDSSIGYHASHCLACILIRRNLSSPVRALIILHLYIMYHDQSPLVFHYYVCMFIGLMFNYVFYHLVCMFPPFLWLTSLLGFS